MKIIAIIPAYNTEKAIKGVIEKVSRFVDEVIVVDDGSKDKTYDVAVKTGARVIRHNENRGYGGAQKTLFRTALKDDGDIIVLIHGDGQHNPEEIPKLLELLLNNNSDVILGSRVFSGKILDGEMPLFRFIGNRILTKLENMAFGTDINDYHTGFRCYTREVLEEIDFDGLTDGFHFDSEILLEAHKKHFKITEVSVGSFYDEDVKSYVNLFGYGLNIILLIFKYLGFKIKEAVKW